MILDLEGSDKNTSINADILIVGAGTAGLYLANKLAGQDSNVVVVERGGVAGKRASKDSVTNIGIPYKGHFEGRSFGLGGTSTLWGGQMIPLSRTDLADRDAKYFSNWPIEYQDLSPHFSSVQKSLGLNSYCKSDLQRIKKRFFPAIFNLNDSLSLRISQWIPFKKRNFGKFYYKMVNSKSRSSIKVWINAPVIRITKTEVQKEYKITEVLAKSPSGNLLTISPKKVVICAGAIESTRLLLEFESENFPLGQRSPVLGRFFSDHLSVNLGEVIPDSFTKANLALAPIFYKGIMHTPRLELSAKFQRESLSPSAFIHFVFLTKGGTPFDFIRDLLRSMQDGRKIEGNLSIVLAFKSVAGLLQMTFWRLFFKRLKFPKDSKILLQIDFEQMANRDSIVKLESETKKGKGGLILDWNFTECEMENIHNVSKEMISILQKSNLGKTFKLKPLLDQNSMNISNIHDVYHPTGTISMGSDFKNSVVDLNLKLHNCTNLYVSSTAVFPAPGSANPGLTHLALTDRLGDFLINKKEVN